MAVVVLTKLLRFALGAAIGTPDCFNTAKNVLLLGILQAISLFLFNTNLEIFDPGFKESI